MGRRITTFTTWTCDRCNAEVESQKGTKPSTARDPWAWFKMDQDSGWDYQGCAWAPRMREPVLLCGKCAEDVIACLNTRPERAAPDAEERET